MITSASPKVVAQTRNKIRVKQYKSYTGQAYIGCLKRFILRFDKRHPRDLGATEVEAFLTHFVVKVV